MPRNSCVESTSEQSTVRRDCSAHRSFRPADIGRLAAVLRELGTFGSPCRARGRCFATDEQPRPRGRRDCGLRLSFALDRSGAWPDGKVLVLTHSDSEQKFARTGKRVRGYLLLGCSLRELSDGIRQCTGKCCARSLVADRIAEK